MTPTVQTYSDLLLFMCCNLELSALRGQHLAWCEGDFSVMIMYAGLGHGREDFITGGIASPRLHLPCSSKTQPPQKLLAAVYGLNHQ